MWLLALTRERFLNCLEFQRSMPKPRIFIGADHHGFTLKQELIAALTDWGYSVKDVGAYSDHRTDFPPMAFSVAQQVAKQPKKSLGLLMCGSGIGMAIAANKVKGARAALVMNPSMAKQGVEHDQANILVLPARYMTKKQAKQALQAFLTAQPNPDPAYHRRVKLITQFERLS